MEKDALWINDIVDKSVILCNQAFRGKRIPRSLVPHLYLSFAAFYLYYGADAINTIFSVYKDSNFLTTRNHSEVVSNFKYFPVLEDLERSIKDKIIVSRTDSSFMQHSTIHEINHLINSKRFRVFPKNLFCDEPLIRIGLQFMGARTHKVKNYYINEVINSHEAEGVETVVYKYIYPYKDAIKNESIKKLLNELDPKNDIYSYKLLQYENRYLFEEESFYQKLKKDMFQGNFKNIDDNCTETFGISFKELSKKVDLSRKVLQKVK